MIICCQNSHYFKVILEKLVTFTDFLITTNTTDAIKGKRAHPNFEKWYKISVLYRYDIYWNINENICIGFKDMLTFPTDLFPWFYQIYHPQIKSCWTLLPDILHQTTFEYFSCDQPALRTLISVRSTVRPSVCLFVCHTFFTMFLYQHEILRSYYHWQKWCPCKRSRSEVKGVGHRGQSPI